MAAPVKHKLNPPFRGDHNGSFLRPRELLEARKQAYAGKLSHEDLKKLEDKHIAELVRKQQEVGIRATTDGEFRRQYFHLGTSSCWVFACGVVTASSRFLEEAGWCNGDWSNQVH